MSKPVIKVEALSKAYRIGVADEKHETLAATVASWVKAPFRNLQRLSRLNTASSLSLEDSASSSSDIHWALRDISFDIGEGEVVGIIGRNGAGKSTLLKILSRITDPTSGRATIYGRVSSLLEVGTGFHPELSGRENVYMNGTILGMRKKEIDRKFDEIVAFSGVEKFIDTPVKRYSSGMKVRLAFAVAAHLEPEILIIDEVLAVGDFEFQGKCIRKMGEVASSGRTVLFVSHNMAAVENLCSRAILLNNGALKADDSVALVVRSYHEEGGSLINEKGLELTEHPGRPSRYSVVMRSIAITDSENRPINAVRIGTDIGFLLTLRSEATLSRVLVIIRIFSAMDERICTLHSRFQSKDTFDLQGEHTIRCVLDRKSVV